MTAVLIVAAVLIALTIGTGVGFLASRRLDTPAPIREDYRTYDLNRLEGWGYGGTWLDDTHRSIMIDGPIPRTGDVVIGTANEVHVVTGVSAPRRPADRSVVEVKPWRRRKNLAWRLPPRDRDPEAGDFL